MRVQGELAAAEIVAAVRHLNRRGGFDVLILARGGGSPEDLAPFNDERVARALAASLIPTISGVGHETDWTICDFVADLRAPTPSAAAELVVERKDEIARRVAQAQRRLLRAMRSRLELSSGRGFPASGARRSWPGFRAACGRWRGRVAQSRDALVGCLERRPAEYAARVAAARRVLADFPRVAELARRRDAVAEPAREAGRTDGAMGGAAARAPGELSRKLDVLSPLAVLARGYAVAYRKGARAPIVSAESVGDGRSHPRPAPPGRARRRGPRHRAASRSTGRSFGGQREEP